MPRPLWAADTVDIARLKSRDLTYDVSPQCRGCTFLFSFFLSLLVRSYMSITPGSANLEILIKIKNKKTHKKKTHTKKQKNFWLNFCLNKECPKLLCGLGICHRRRQTIPMWNSSGGKKNSSGHHCMSGVCGIEHYVMTW